jgi:tetratricopeptide (TPR) repeat protein
VPSRDEFLARARKKEAAAKDDVARAREELGEMRGANEAGQMLQAAERELSFGRSQGALDLAQRAEATDRNGTLGALPASTQARAYLKLGRPADAARVATRLLAASPADPLVVDGLLAGADAAVAVGDRGLALRLLRRALLPENVDAARRAQAQKRLDGVAVTTKAKTATP